jgi:hypothetical protein
LRGAMMLGCWVFERTWIRLSFWTRRRHSNIVAPESGGVSSIYAQV